jgi:hypothetical protein
MNPHIAIRDNVVIKTGHPAIMRVEVAKLTRAYEIAQRCHLFQVPKVLGFNESAGQINSEFIPDLHNLRNAVTSEEMSASLMKKIGAALAVIHKDLFLPKDMTLPLPQAYNVEGTEVFLHGDYGLANIYLTPSNGRIVILDWQAVRKLDVPATYGSRYFDLMCFVYNLFYRPVGSKRYKMAVAAAPMAQQFLHGYFETSDFVYDQIQFQNYMKQFLHARLANRKSGGHWKRRLSLIPCHIKLRRFIKSYDFNQVKSMEHK